MSAKEIPVTIDKFLGVNRRDGADLVDNREFYTLQNCFHKVKGLLYKRQGTTASINASDIAQCQSILGFHRQVGIQGELYTLLYCQGPAANTIAAATTAPTLTDITAADGDLFNGGAIALLTYVYSWVGIGGETTASNLASITVASATNYVRVTVPTFPTGVVSANVFQLQGATYTICGVIKSSGGHIDVKAFQGPNAADDDADGMTLKISASSGSLKKGRYYFAAAWYVGAGTRVHNTTTLGSNVIDVDRDNAAIDVREIIVGAATANGATWAHIFMGLEDSNRVPLSYVGTVKCKAAADASNANNLLTVTALSEEINFCCYPSLTSAPGNQADWFSNRLSGGLGADNLGGVAFVVKQKADGTYKQVCFPRLNDISASYGPNYDIINPFTGAAYTPSTDASGASIRYRHTSLLNGANTSFASFLGMAFIANGYNLLLMCDGYTVSEIREIAGTIQPGYPTQVIVFKNQLVVSVARVPASGSGVNAPVATVVPSQAQIYGSNALKWDNWASGGSGPALRYATVGDPFGDGVTALGVLSFTSATTGPSSLITAFKKASSFVYTGVPDQTSSIPVSMDVLSSRVGCVAPNSIVNTPIGTIFAGHDGDIYFANGSGEPKRIGTKIKPLIDPIVGSDTLMALMSACYDDNHYKLSYPSSTSSTANDAQLWADIRIDQGPLTWSGPHTGIDVGKQIVFSADGDNTLRYALKGDGSKIMLMDDTSTFQDLGSAIATVIQWKTSRLGDDRHRKRFMSMFFDLFFDSSFTHNWLVEGFAEDQYGRQNISLSTGAGTWNSTNWDSGLWGAAEYFPVNCFFSPETLVGRTFYWKASHSNNAQIILAAADILYRPERRRTV